MATRTARIEVVHSDAGWFARVRAANGRKVWQTEIYSRRWGATRAVLVLVHLLNPGADVRIDVDGVRVTVPDGPGESLIPVVELDDRTPVEVNADA